MITNLLKDRFIKNSFIYMTGTVLGGFSGFLFHFLVSRKLSVAEYGELGSLVSFSSVLGVLSSALSFFVVKYCSVFAKAKDYVANWDFTSKLRLKINKLAFLLFLLFLLLSPVIFKLLHLSNFWGLIFIGFALLFSLLSIIYSSTLNAWQEFTSISLIGISSSFVKVVSGFLLVLFFPRASIVVGAFLISALFGWALIKVINHKKFYVKKGEGEPQEDWQKKYFSKINIKATILPIFVFSLMVGLINNLDVMLVKNLTTSELTGYYSVLSLLGKIVLYVNSAIVAVILPSACANGFSGQSISRKILFSAYGLISFISFVATILYFLFPELWINLFFGSKYAMFKNDLWLFGILAFILSVLMLESNLAYARHDFKISYILGGVVVLMTTGIYLFHANIREVALSIIFSLALGYFLTLIRSLTQRKAVH